MLAIKHFRLAILMRFLYVNFPVSFAAWLEEVFATPHRATDSSDHLVAPYALVIYVSISIFSRNKSSVITASGVAGAVLTLVSWVTTIFPEQFSPYSSWRQDGFNQETWKFCTRDETYEVYHHQVFADSASTRHVNNISSSRKKKQQNSLFLITCYGR